MPRLPDDLLLAAFPPELCGLDATPPPGWRAACVGIGAVAAAVATARLLSEQPAGRVLFVGTCGAYDARLDPGDLVAATEAIATSLDEREGRAYRPAAERVRWLASWALPARFAPHAVAVPPAITSTIAGAAALATLAAAEHLELTGVFAACAELGIPVAAALGVANRVGPDAHVEWRTRHAAVSRAVIEALREDRVL